MATEKSLHQVKKPGVAVDVILFTVQNDDLKVGLIKRDEDPYFGKHALPGRFVRYKEPIIETAKTALKLKGKIDPSSVYLEQLHTFGDDLVRDTRIRTITIVYYGLIPVSKLDQKGNLFEWHSVYNLPTLAFDHKSIIMFAIKKLRRKLFETELVFQLMPKSFTLTELQNTFETILNKELDKRNFRKKIAELYKFQDLNKKKREGAFRPANIYSFIGKREI